MSSFRRRLIMSVKKQDEYTELKCLRSTRTQYIDGVNTTGTITKSNKINIYDCKIYDKEN